jgi:hypothetical protein
MARGEHEQILLAYGSALFRATLLGQLGQLDISSARPGPPARATTRCSCRTRSSNGW